jgi:hypothetical protein
LLNTAYIRIIYGLFIYNPFIISEGWLLDVLLYPGAIPEGGHNQELNGCNIEVVGYLLIVQKTGNDQIRRPGRMASKKH